MTPSLIETLRKEKRCFLAALFPPKCLACRKEGYYLCKRHREFPAAPTNKAHFENIDHVHASTAYYHFTAKKTVEFLKFRGFQEVATLMAEQIVKDLPRTFWHHAILVPIPLHWMRKFWRGFNQADLLALELEKIVPELTISRGLKRTKYTSQQSKLSKHARKRNMKNVFIWDEKVTPPLRVILIDDVVASGSTLDSAAGVLKDAGVKTVDAVVFARGGKENNE
jgi:ComF family protein